MAAAPAFVQLIERLRETGGLKDTDIANFARVSVETVSRWETGREAPHPKTQLLVSDLASLFMRLEDHYRPNEIRTSLYARHPQLNGERAIDRIQAGQTEDVLAILDRLDIGVYL